VWEGERVTAPPIPIFKTFYFMLQNLSLAADLRGFLRINWIKVGTLNL